MKAVFPRAAPEHRLRFKAALEAEGIDGLTLDDFRQATRASRAFQKAFMLDARHFAGRDLCALIRSVAARCLPRMQLPFGALTSRLKEMWQYSWQHFRQIGVHI